MRKIIVGLVILGMCFASNVQAGIFDKVKEMTGIADVEIFSNEFSHGFRVGHFPKLSKHTARSYEGYLFEGKNSTQKWMFTIQSDQKELIEKALDLVGMDVVIEYSEKKIDTAIRDQIPYKVVNIFPVMNLDFHATEEIAMKKGWTDKSQGIRSGYFSKASKKGNMTKTYEVTLQEGKMGNVFIPMSVNNKEMFQYIQECIKGGKWLRVHYIDMGVNLKGTDSQYLIHKVQIIE